MCRQVFEEEIITIHDPPRETIDIHGSSEDSENYQDIFSYRHVRDIDGEPFYFDHRHNDTTTELDRSVGL